MNLVLKKLNSIIQEKQTRLAVAADLTTTTEILELAEKIGDQICILKTHIDIVENFSMEFTKELRQIADEKNFLIFEDRKFADIGNTVSLQFSKGIYHIADWADIINAHTIVGPGIIEGLKKVNKNSALLLLAQMTPSGNLFTPEYAMKSLEIAKEHKDFVIGFIGSSDKVETLQMLREESGDDFTIMTPGIKLAKGNDNLSQTYNTPKKAISNGADIIIVGRGIYQANDMEKASKEYKEASWI